MKTFYALFFGVEKFIRLCRTSLVYKALGLYFGTKLFTLVCSAQKLYTLEPSKQCTPGVGLIFGYKTFYA